MKCLKCDGVGFSTYPDGSVKDECPRCSGTGQIKSHFLTHAKLEMVFDIDAIRKINIDLGLTDGMCTESIEVTNFMLHVAENTNDAFGVNEMISFGGVEVEVDPNDFYPARTLKYIRDSMDELHIARMRSGYEHLPLTITTIASTEAYSRLFDTVLEDVCNFLHLPANTTWGGTDRTDGCETFTTEDGMHEFILDWSADLTIGHGDFIQMVK